MSDIAILFIAFVVFFLIIIVACLIVTIKFARKLKNDDEAGFNPYMYIYLKKQREAQKLKHTINQQKWDDFRDDLFS